jgi:phage I-like protein
MNAKTRRRAKRAAERERLVLMSTRLITCRAVPYAAAPVVDGPWDASAAEQRLRKWAGVDGDNPPASAWHKYAEGFAIVEGAGDKLGAFKLPHHDIRDGKLVTVKKGVEAAIGALNGARGGMSISPSEKASALAHLEKHREQFEKTARCPGMPVTMAMAAGPVAKTWNQIAKAGAWDGHPAGPFEFDPDIYKQIIANHNATENKRVQVDYEHKSETLDGNVAQEGAPAVAWVTQLEVRGDELWGLFEWTSQQAVDQVRSGQYMFVSPAVVFNATDRTTGQNIGARLTSVALTNHPFLDGMEPLAASETAAVAEKNSAERAGATVVTASLSPDAVHIPAAIGPKAKKETAMADLEQKQDNEVGKAIMKRLKTAMKFSDDDMGMDDNDVFARLSDMFSDYTAMKAASAKKMAEEADADVTARVECGDIPKAARSHALKLRISDPEAFNALYPKREKAVTMSDARQTVMTSSVSSVGNAMPKQPERSTSASDHSTMAHERALKLMSESGGKLGYSAAIITASRELKQADDSRIADAIARVVAEGGR